MALTKCACGFALLMLWSSLMTAQVPSSRISHLAQGVISRQSYVNSELGLRYELPKGWAVSSKETIASHQFAWVDYPSAKGRRSPAQCSKNLLFVTKHPEGMALSGFDPMALMIAIDSVCFPEIVFPKSTADHELVQRSTSQILSHLQTPDGVLRGAARIQAFDNAGRVMLEISRPLSITTHEVTFGSRTMIRNVNRSVLIMPAAGYLVAWIFVTGDDVDMDYLKATKTYFDAPADSSPTK